MSRKATYAISISLEVWAMAFLVPYIYKLHEDNFDYEWTNMVRISPFLLAPVLYFFTITGLYNDSLFCLRVSMFLYFSGLISTIVMVFFAMHPSSSYV